MLSDIEKEKIKLEETYRTEIKKLIEVKDKKSWLSKLTAFLNSSFGLWLLSAIFISGGVKLFEDYKAKKEQTEKLNEVISKIDLEIGYRFSRVLVNLFELTNKNIDSASLSKKFTETDVKKVAVSLNSSKNSTGEFLYVDYTNFTLLTLIAEEKRVLEQLKKYDGNLNQVISDISGLEVFYDVQKVKFGDVQAVATSIEKYLILPRWKDSQFYFLDGNENNPFP